MSGKLHLICMKTEGFHAKIRCYLNDGRIARKIGELIFVFIIYLQRITADTKLFLTQKYKILPHWK